MSKYIKTLIAIAIISCLLTINVKAEENVNISINDLVTESSEFDNKTIVISGEVIGEVIERGEYCWININDGTNAIGIWIEKSKVNDLNSFGDYRHVGDFIEVEGVFFSGCGEHDGEIDFHGEKLKIVKVGYENQEVITFYEIMIMTILFLMAILVSIIYLKKIKNKEY